MACSVVFCTSRTLKNGVKDPDLSFHTFPKWPEMRIKWIKAVRRENWEPTKYSRICSKHFEKSNFIIGLSMKKLKSDAIPTIFERYPEYFEAVAKERKEPHLREETIPSSSETQLLIPRRMKNKRNRGINTEVIPSMPTQVLTSLSKSRMVALRRLRALKILRERNRRLAKKNTILKNIIYDLKNKILLFKIKSY